MTDEYRRVVITGLGAVTPLGPDVETSWRRLIAGEGACAPITAWNKGDPAKFVTVLKAYQNDGRAKSAFAVAGATQCG